MREYCISSWRTTHQRSSCSRTPSRVVRISRLHIRNSGLAKFAQEDFRERSEDLRFFTAALSLATSAPINIVEFA